ncbi:MAG: hypothetical protein EON93_18145 [Burkholderiales bacterium]|jgi:hypothetical protein|nr:MAG: hypothetical protein EON93_18145 [Burkholderiales bacterium]
MQHENRLGRRQVLLGVSVCAAAGVFAAPAIAKPVPVIIGDKAELNVRGGFSESYEHPSISSAVKTGNATFRVRFRIEKAHRNDKWISLLSFSFPSGAAQRLNVDFRDYETGPSLLITPRLWQTEYGKEQTLKTVAVVNRKKAEPHDLTFSTGADSVTMTVGEAQMIMRTGFKPQALVVNASGLKAQVEFLAPSAG